MKKLAYRTLGVAALALGMVVASGVAAFAGVTNVVVNTGSPTTNAAITTAWTSQPPRHTNPSPCCSPGRPGQLPPPGPDPIAPGSALR